MFSHKIFQVQSRELLSQNLLLNLHSNLIRMRERYCNSGAVMELPVESKKMLGLQEPNDWNISQLNLIQARLLEPLISYW